MTPPAEIRALVSHADFAACVALQREIWGAGFSDVVAPSILKVAQRVGGVAAGAFDPSGQMLGFVFGLTGVRPQPGANAIVHWSDMLAVRSDARNTGLASRLKEFQRRAAQEVGATVMFWTFDPLVSRNAHLNFNKLGATASEYVPDMYGPTDSPLHGGLATDRLIVAWSLDDDAVAARKQRLRDAMAVPGWDTAPILNDTPDQSPAAVRFLPRVRIRVPADFERLLDGTTDRAAIERWRMETRRAFASAFAAGYSVEGVSAARGAPEAFYLLARGATA